MASVRGALSFPAAAKNVGQLSDPRGGAARQDVFVAADVEEPLGCGREQKARSAYRKAKKLGRGQKRREKLKNKNSVC